MILVLCIVAYVAAISWFLRNYKDPLNEPEEFCHDDAEKERKLKEYCCDIKRDELGN